ncbi:hypothetical protein D3C76_1770430 [compost metagenome]
MDDQGRHIELFQVITKIRFRERLDAVQGVLVAAHHALHPERVDQPLGGFGVRAVEAEEWTAGDVLVEL